MRVLFLSCSTGGGHDSAAKALIEQFEDMNVECTMVDAVEFSDKKFYNKFNDLYLKIINGPPTLFKSIYKAGQLYGKLKIKSPLYGINVISGKNLEELILKNNFDLIIATHLFPAHTLTHLKKKNNINFIFVLTDYTVIPFINEVNADYFVIGSKDLKKELIDKGILSNKILDYGIPVSKKFNTKYSKVEARKMKSLPLDKKIILMMSGSMGYGNLDDTIDEINNNYLEDVHVVVVCGNNEKLRIYLSEKYKDTITVVGFTKDINIYMNASDVILTKPGGLTSTEVAVSNSIPIFVNAIPGVEDYNERFFVDRNMGLSIKKNTVKSNLDLIFKNKNTIKKINRNQDKYINKFAAEDLCKFSIKNFGNMSKNV